MKKSIKKMAVVAMMLVAGSTMTVNAQLLSEKPRVHLGIRGGVSASSYSGDGIKSKIFPMGGFAVDFKVAPIPLYLESGLYYVNRGYKLDIPDDYYYDEESSNAPKYEIKISATNFFQRKGWGPYGRMVLKIWGNIEVVEIKTSQTVYSAKLDGFIGHADFKTTDRFAKLFMELGKSFSNK